MAPNPASFIDAAGRSHKPAGEEARIVSLAPPLTELCLALDLAPRLVGCSDDCSLPPEQAAAIARLGPPDAPDLARFRELQPSHVLVHADVTPGPVRLQLAETGADPLVVRPRKPADNFDLFALVGGIFGAPTAADTLARRFELALARVKMGLRKRRVRRVLYLVGKAPFKTVARDSYAAALLALARLELVGAEAGADETLVPVDLTQSLLLSVDMILLSGASGAFKGSDVKRLASDYDIARDKLLLLEQPLAELYGARAIGAMDDLVALRARIDAGQG